MYDGSVGRWTAPDPLAENHYACSPYHYALNNPLRYIDPLSLDTIDVSGDREYSGKIKVGDYIYYGDGGGDLVTSQWLQDNFEGIGIDYYSYIKEVMVNHITNKNRSATYTGAGKIYPSIMEDMIRSLASRPPSVSAYEQRMAAEMSGMSGLLRRIIGTCWPYRCRVRR